MIAKAHRNPRDNKSRRREILKAALACFTEKGLAAATMDDIRIRSRASVGSIYHHFAGKEQLAAALYLEGLVDYQQGLLRELGRIEAVKPSAPERGVKLVVDHYLRWVAANPAWAQFLLNMGNTPLVESMRDEIAALNDRFFGTLLTWFQPYVERGIVAPLPMAIAVSILIGPSREFARQWLKDRSAARMREARNVLPAAAWNSLQAKLVRKDSKHASHKGKRDVSRFHAR